MIVSQDTFKSALLDAEIAHPTGLEDGQGGPAGKRFDVYRNNVAVSLTEALETSFPVVRKLVGEQNFKILAGSFLRQHLPDTPLMMFYGKKMPDFLAAFGPTSSIGYLPDVARLEIALRESYHAGDNDIFDVTKVADLSPDELMASKITFSASMRVVQSQWPIYSIWEFNTFDDAPKPQMVAQDVLIGRVEFDPIPHELPADVSNFISALVDGKTLAQAMSSVPDSFDLSSALSVIFQAGVVNDFGVK